MIICNCQTCKKENLCSLQNDYAKASLFAFGRDSDAPACTWHEPDFWHGIEGVINTNRTPANNDRTKNY